MIVKVVDELDYEIYKCISSDFTNKEVIITDLQIEHIKSGHPEAFDYVMGCLKETLESPDYIFKDKYPNSGLVVKRISKDGKIVEMIIKLHMKVDPLEYYNSIISAWTISQRRLESYIRNKDILYKKQG